MRKRPMFTEFMSCRLYLLVLKYNVLLTLHTCLEVVKYVVLYRRPTNLQLFVFTVIF